MNQIDDTISDCWSLEFCRKKMEVLLASVAAGTWEAVGNPRLLCPQHRHKEITSGLSKLSKRSKTNYLCNRKIWDPKEAKTIFSLENRLKKMRTKRKCFHHHPSTWNWCQKSNSTSFRNRWVVTNYCRLILQDLCPLSWLKSLFMTEGERIPHLTYSCNSSSRFSLGLELYLWASKWTHKLLTDKDKR